MNISKCIPNGTTEIVTVKNVGINACVEKYANSHMLPKLILNPSSKNNDKTNILKYYKLAISISDEVVAIFEEFSQEIQYIIQECNILGKKHNIYFYSLSNTAFTFNSFNNQFALG
jgi:phosphoribosylaminoimidazole-succinocarboxamide synthase